jgi:hypothetical protein
MTKVGLNVLFSINQSVSHHNIMLLLPYVSQLSNVTSQLKDIYGLGAQLLVMIMTWWHVVLTSPEDLLILYRSGIFAIDSSVVNFQTCPRHRDDLEVYWKRQKRTYRSPHPAKTSSKSYAKCSRLRGIQASTCKHFWVISITFLTVAAVKNLINC